MKPLHKKYNTTLPIPFKRWRAPLYLLLVGITAAWGITIMLNIITTNQITFIEPIIFLLFAANFFWISMSFWTSIIGFLLALFKRDPLTLQKKHCSDSNKKTLCLYNQDTNAPITKRTALVMPVYNEDPVRVISGIEATLTSLVKTGEQSHFDFYILSDTNNDVIAEEEQVRWQQLRQRMRTANIKIFYRRRTQNDYRKVGNIADFCQRWGSLYDYMLVLDADSVMDGVAITQMVRAMQNLPSAGLLQTVPRPVRQKTFFGRFVQFAAELHSPLLASGNSFWQTDCANYWGHNALIRIDAFMENCCLPYLTGQPPFGGEILSHDFVEAALLKRGDWAVFNITDTLGSYEEVPSNIIDFVIRDRRWAQGNLQHLRLLKTRGLHAISRFHFLSGAMSYISSLLWLVMLGLGTTDAVIQALNSNQFFSEPYQLFPNWHIAKPELIYSLLGLTALFLFTPKILALIINLFGNAKRFGGPAHLIISSLIEMVIAILIAPVMMIFHSYFVLSALVGANVGWKTQERNGRGIPWGEAIKYTLLVTIVAIFWGGLAYVYAPKYFWWLLPVLTGLALSAPIIRYSSSINLGKFSYKLGIFKVASETMAIDVLESIDSYQNYYKKAPLHFIAQQNEAAIPIEQWKKMPIQHL